MVLELYPRNSTFYAISGTTTYRLASRKMMRYMGIQRCTNLQNIEKSIREIYIPDNYRIELEEKYAHFQLTDDITIFTEEELQFVKVFCQSDQSGAEALIVAYACKPGRFRDLFIYGVKPHVYVAIHVFADEWQRRMQKHSFDIKFDIHPFLTAPIKDIKSLPFWKELDSMIRDSDNWPAKERYYFLAKQMCHSLNYDAQAGAFQLNVLEKSKGKVVLSKREAERYVHLYNDELFPEIPEMRWALQEQLETTKCLYNFFGHPRKVTGELTKTNLKEWYAFPFQSTVGTITNIAYTNLQNYIEDNNKNWDMMQNNHDSYLSQASILERIDLAKKQKEFLNIKLTNFRGEQFSMKSETQIGFNWGTRSVKPDGTIKNACGLKEVKL